MPLGSGWLWESSPWVCEAKDVSSCSARGLTSFPTLSSGQFLPESVPVSSLILSQGLCLTHLSQLDVLPKHAQDKKVFQESSSKEWPCMGFWMHSHKTLNWHPRSHWNIYELTKDFYIKKAVTARLPPSRWIFLYLIFFLSYPLKPFSLCVCNFILFISEGSRPE